jgi:flavorubredoxin
MVTRLRRRCGAVTVAGTLREGCAVPVPTADSQLLVVCSSHSGNTARLVEALVEGTRSEGIEGVDVVVRAPLDAGPDDVLSADLVVLAAPPNLGMINGLMKDFLERIYYPCLDHTAGKPCALVFKGDTDATGALANTEKILTGLKWKQVQPPFVVIGELTEERLDAARELGATLAGGLAFDLW